MPIDSGTIEIIDNRIEVRPNIYPRICPKEAMYVCQRDSELEINYENIYQEIINDSSDESSKATQIDLDNIFRVIHRSKAGMLIYSRYWDSLWLPDNLVVGVASPLENRFLVVPDKLAVRSPIAIEPIPQRERCLVKRTSRRPRRDFIRCANDDLDCQYRVVKCEDGNSREHLYPNNSLWQIDRYRADDCIIALDPAGNPIEIDRHRLDCFVSIDIALIAPSQL